VNSGIENMLFEIKSVYERMNTISNISRIDTSIRHQIGTKSHIKDLFMIGFKQFEVGISVSGSESVGFEPLFYYSDSYLLAMP